MNDTLDEGAPDNPAVIRAALKAANDFKIRPLDIHGEKYYFWVHDKNGGLVPSDDPGARDVLVEQIGEWR